jgi:hypothetical protein
LLILKIFEYKLLIVPVVEVNVVIAPVVEVNVVIVPVVDDNVVIVPDGVVIDGIVAAPFWFTNHDLVESETLINPNVELLL